MEFNRNDVDCNFVDLDNWNADIHARFKWLRENEPVYWSEQTELWMITDFENVSAVSKNQDLFTSEQGVRPKDETIIGLIDEGEPRHAALRKMINKGFTPRMVKRLEQQFRRITTEAIDDIAKLSECDFTTSFSVPLPIRLIAVMMGIREQDFDRFHKWSDTMIAADGNKGNPEIMAASAQAFVEYSMYVTEMIEERRREPKEDLISILVGARDQGLLDKEFTDDRSLHENHDDAYMEMANDELLILLVVLMVAGNETTRNGISGGMELLIENPQERQKLLDDPSLIPTAVEEMLRLTSPVQTFARTVTEDTELNGKKLRKGQQVCVVYPSANRDQKQFEDAEVFRIDRNPSHLAFGVGSHFCLGANLARMEMRVAFEEVLRRLPDMEFSRGGPEFFPSTLVRSLTHMWVKYTPEAG